MKVHEGINGRLREFIIAQPVFFVGTAPTSPDGHVNVSPKGMAGTFAVLGEHRVAYLDYTGSGAETVAHLRDNGRIVLMFCAFSGPPNIVRLHGRGRAVPRDSAEYAELLEHFTPEQEHGARTIIDVEVERVSDSCGFSVPLMDYAGERDLLLRMHSRRSDDDLTEYWTRKDSHSIDGLPALEGTGLVTEPAP
ncbi:pyridoxamine 5'-phosphate oxidase family protein [Prauserella cavernicola]|uniref:Pyridoxamine 5'-phosphate oxidase family protein n=1 Tax=Prauserella cavernicola TaxID=2800127 RepID=A0A934QRL3_9PSEU|nr:pyridoxamine 5'-phosphate oxidase family protein [Prauserella cavernicola]MBK1786937.1 pyridoxamine 5'-phosphate oxidase family protein [Prauserella cavernicola]